MHDIVVPVGFQVMCIRDRGLGKLQETSGLVLAWVTLIVCLRGHIRMSACAELSQTVLA